MLIPKQPEKLVFVRADFPMLQQKINGYPLIYFDSAATSLKPRCVVEALQKFYLEEYGTVHRAVYTMATVATENYCRARATVQHFLGASSSDEIIFTKGTTEAINLVASSFGKGFIQPGDEILVSQIEHHANIVPWQMMCQERGALLRVIPVDNAGNFMLDAYKKLLSPKVKLVAVAHIASAIGSLLPIDEIVPLAHQVGAKVLLDGAQSAAHLPIDVRALDVDFFAFSGHKTYGPTGIGVLYGKRELLEQMPPYQGGGDMVSQVSFEKTTYQAPPLKFEAGTPLIAQALALAEALKYIQSVGKEQIASWEQQLLTHATEQLQEIDGLRIIGTARHKGPIISFYVDGIHPLDIGTLLDLKGIAVRTGLLCAQPTMEYFNVPATVRLSFALYNTLEEIDSFVASLRLILSVLR